MDTNLLLILMVVPFILPAMGLMLCGFKLLLLFALESAMNLCEWTLEPAVPFFLTKDEQKEREYLFALHEKGKSLS